jgi:D-xylose transport system permease protein
MKDYFKRNGVWLGFLFLAVVISIATHGDFLSPRNLTNVIRQTSINGILAGGMTLIILTGGIDLSVGSLVALCGIGVGLSQVNLGWANLGIAGAFGSLAISVGLGTVAGFVNGALIGFLGIVPFVITLGMMVIARGLAMILSNGSSISPMGEMLDPLANAYLPLPLTIILIVLIIGGFVYQNLKASRGSEQRHLHLADQVFPLLTFALLAYAFLSYRGFPFLALVLTGVLGSLAFVLARTTFGRSIFAIGSNDKAAFWAGVPIRRVTVLVYTIMGFLSGLAGLLLTARLNGAEPNAGQLFELDAIAAVVIGGTSLKGGQGSIMGTLIGALTIATLNNGMDLLGVPSFYQMVFKGLIIILAVSLDRGQKS